MLEIDGMPHLFDPLALRGLTFANRVFVSPMCQYSSVDGFCNEWHVVHLGSRAVGGAGLVFTEATAVTAEGRISPRDLGIYHDAHVAGLAGLVRGIHAQRCPAGIQLAHAGRKASSTPPWQGSVAIGPESGGWQPIAPTGDPFSPTYPVPRSMSGGDIKHVVAAFGAAAARAREAPLVNTRTDEYGGSYDNRVRFCLEVIDTVRAAWPERSPLFVRISATDWKDGGWEIEQSVELARRIRRRGVDLIDCSSGGAVADVTIPIAPGYQVPFAERIRRDAGVATGAVGLITEPAQANEIIGRGRADAVLLARELLRDPYWPLRAARELGRDVPWPVQYLRAAPPGTRAR